MAWLLIGCSQDGGTGIPAPHPVEGAAATVTVERADIESTLTLNAVVAGPARFIVAAPFEAEVTEFRDDMIVLTTADGSRHEMGAPERTAYLQPLVSLGLRVPANYPIAEARLNGFALRARAEGSTIYRLYSPPAAVRGQVLQGPGPFDCPLLQRMATVEDLEGGTQQPVREDSPPLASESASSAGGFTLLCAVPADVDVLSGMPAVMALTTAAAHDVLSLPLEAVAGTARSGEVLVETPSGLEVREVELGVTDGVRIEITRGVTEGEVVRIPAPDLSGASDVGG